MEMPLSFQSPKVWTIYLLVTLLALIMASDNAFAGDSITTVTTYVVRTQEEREQTRWTLTEWLRIKERTKLMDVWLTMFSDTNKDKFRPELNASFLATRSTMQRKIDGAITENGTSQGNTMKAQVWMTNLVSSKVGIRTLNIDLGFEAGGRDSGLLSPKNAATSSTVAASIPADLPSAKSNWYTMDVRLFGKNVQDSSLVLKYGLMQTKNSFQLSNSTLAPTLSKESDSVTASGSTAGAELQLYITKWLGVEGTAHKYHATAVAYGNHSLEGTYGEELGFIEIGILRLQGGIYEERWSATWSAEKTSTLERGYVAGIKLLL